MAAAHLSRDHFRSDQHGVSRIRDHHEHLSQGSRQSHRTRRAPHSTSADRRNLGAQTIVSYGFGSQAGQGHRITTGSSDSVGLFVYRPALAPVRRCAVGQIGFAAERIHRYGRRYCSSCHHSRERSPTVLPNLAGLDLWSLPRLRPSGGRRLSGRSDPLVRHFHRSFERCRSDLQRSSRQPGWNQNPYW